MASSYLRVLLLLVFCSAVLADENPYTLPTPDEEVRASHARAWTHTAVLPLRSSSSMCARRRTISSSSERRGCEIGVCCGRPSPRKLLSSHAAVGAGDAGGRSSLVPAATVEDPTRQRCCAPPTARRRHRP